MQPNGSTGEAGPAKYLRALAKQFPRAPSLTLAKRAHREHPEYWATLDTCRSAVRRIFGVVGSKRNKQHTADKSLMREPRKPGWQDVIPDELLELPNWHAEQIDGKNRTLILSDIHIPFHSAEALEASLDWGLKKKPTIILINGDGVDHYWGSRFITDPAMRDFPGEVLKTKQFLSGLRKRFGRYCRIIYKHGNHEERFDLYMRVKCPELLGLPHFDWQEVFGLGECKVELIRQKRPIRLGKLNVIHGHEYNFQIANPVNPARGFFLRAKTHVIGGHFHQSSSHSEKSLEQTVISAWSTGCLCGLHPEYRPLNTWNHGFAYAETTADGSFYVENLRIINGKVY